MHVQPYVQEIKGSLAKQPFVMIIQDKCMLEMCIQLSYNNAWATFKTNWFGLPLYAAAAPNNIGLGIPLWYILCSSDSGSNHEQIALEMTLRIIFKRMESLRPNAIVKDKSWKEYNAITNV